MAFSLCYAADARWKGPLRHRCSHRLTVFSKPSSASLQSHVLGSIKVGLAGTWQVDRLAGPARLD